MRIICFILAAIFFASAALQFNDPDPLLWVALYGVTGLIAIFAAFDHYNPWVILIVLAACVYEALKIFPAFGPCAADGLSSIVDTMKAETPCVEIVREFLGVLITIGGLVFFYVRARRKQLVAVEEEAPRF